MTAIAGGLLLAALAAVAAMPGGAGRARAEGSAPNGPPTAGDAFEPVLGLPASRVIMLGAAPGSGETWAYGTIGEQPATTTAGPRQNQLVLLDHSEAEQQPSVERSAGWRVVALPDDAQGHPLELYEGTFPGQLGGLGGKVTRAGGVVLLTDGGIVTRDPGGEPQLLKASASPLLGAHETLPPSAPSAGAPTAYTAIEEGQRTGILIAPYGDGEDRPPGVLRYDGGGWTREQIETPAAGQPGYKPGFAPVAIACAGAQPMASSPEDCWLLAAYKNEAAAHIDNRLTLFRRVAAGAAGEPAWREQAVENPAGTLLGEVPTGGEPDTVQALGPDAQTLTATSQGVWVDLQALTLRGHATDVTELIAPREAGGAQALGVWCESGEPFCPAGAKALGAHLPGAYRSFAWAGNGAEPGTRIVTGLEHGTMLELPGGSGGAFTVVTGGGGENGAAAFSDPQHGWIADGTRPDDAPDGGGQPQAIEVTPTPEGDQLQEEAVPFRRPLYAIAQQPGTSVGDPQAQQLAVGERGQVARYAPGEGWRAEALYGGSGKVAEDTLRGVAWPEPERAYAVGDNGAMWLWQAATGLWEPDPAKPIGFVGNLTAVAFSASNPDLGYAVGRQGVLLRYDKTWEQEQQLPPALQKANFTSIAFTGPEEAIASYRYVAREGEYHEVESGGIAIKRSASEPWQVDPQASALLEQLPLADRVVSRVAGLPDGGAVAGGPELMIERDAAGGPWRFSVQPLPEAQSVSALAAYRDTSGAVRAVVSVELDQQFNPHKNDVLLRESVYGVDVPAPTSAGEPPPVLPPDWVPNSGYVLKETASGWSDVEHETLPAGSGGEDLPARPDPVFALLVSPSGATGVAVGGQTGNIEALEPNTGLYPGIIGDQTAAAMRFPAGGASTDGAVAKPIATSAQSASFLVGGQAACVSDCADFANERLGPDVDLTHAIEDANQINTETPGGLRAFLYTGGRFSRRLPVEGGARELERYAALLRKASMQVAVAASPQDVPPNGEEGPFISHLGSFLPGAASGRAYYQYVSSGPRGGPVDVIGLDFSSGELGATQREWLKEQLGDAKTQKIPAIVIGNLPLTPALPDGPGAFAATDAGQVARILVEGDASAYFFDYPAANVAMSIRYGEGKPVPAYGTGTLGYVPSTDEHFQADALGSSGVLLAEVETATRDPTTNRAEVRVRILPNIAELAIDPLDGTLLRRSHVALFDALARRPPGGVAITGAGPGNGTQPLGPDPYDPIPFNCLGPNCASAVPTEYTLTSSDPEVGAFVEHDPSSNNPRQVLLGSNQLPIPDEPRGAHGEPTANGRFAENGKGEPVNERGEVVAADQSGLFCAYNAGTTVVSVTTGGLTYSEPVTVRAGSAEYPCGTVPLKNPPALEAPAQVGFSVPEPPPVEQPPASPRLLSIHVSPPAPAPVPHPHPKPHRPIPPSLPLILATPGLVALRPVILPPPPPVGRPSPPTSSSSARVYQSAYAPERQRDEEEATDLVHNFAAYRAGEGRRLLYGLPLLILALAFGGARLHGRRGRAEQQLAKTAL